MIQINNVSHGFASGSGSESRSKRVLTDIDLTLTESRIAVIGANGSGKSTFVRLLNGLIVPQQGEVTVDGVSTREHPGKVRKNVGFIFQNPENQIVYPIVSEDLAFGLKNLKLEKREIEQRISDILKHYRIEHLANRFTHELSGGEKQLVAMCGVLVMQPDYIVFDEPTTLLDLRNKKKVLNAIEGLRQNAVVVTHDLDMLQMFERVLCFDEGRVVFDGKPEPAVAFYENLMSDSQWS